MTRLSENANLGGLAHKVSRVKEVNEENVDYNRIYEYNDLSFGIPAGKQNRDINENHVRNIYRHMDENLLGEFRVDIVSGMITDGNNKWYAVKRYLEDGNKLTKPLRVIYEKLREGQTVAERIAELNNRRKNWTAQDYIMCKKNQGDKYAKELADFCNERSLLHTEHFDKRTGITTIKPVMRYGGWFIKGVNCSPMFKKNNYVHTPQELENGKAVYNEIEKIMEAADITKTGTWFGEMVSAWRQVREERKDDIASLPNGFDSLIPEFEKKIFIKEETLMNQVTPNMRNFESVIDEALEAVA